MEIIIESPEEVTNMQGLVMWEFHVLEGNSDDLEDPYCAKKEVLMYFENGKEMRIYIDEEGNLCVYTD
jgi:hypothetical protein